MPHALFKDCFLQPTPVKLTAANGEPITIYGQITAETVIDPALRKLRRTFVWTFVVCDIANALLGYDFLNHFGLLVDCKNNLLVDSNTSQSNPVPDYIYPVSQITVNEISSFPSFIQGLIHTYPSVISPYNAHADRPKDQRFYHRIETGDAPPVFAKTRPLFGEKLIAAKSEFENLLSAGIIQPSRSSWSTPLHMVPKKNPNEWRPCGDYRSLNVITKPDRYGLPNMKNLSELCHGKVIFSKIDLMRAYHNIPVHPDDVQKTAITTPFGLFEYLYLPFGLKNAGASFQRFMDTIFRDVDDIFCYLDDIFVASKDQKSHFVTLDKIFQRLHDNNLRINVEKCQFLQTSIDILGFNVDGTSGMRPTVSKTKEISEFPLPTNSKSLRRYLGMLGFYRHLIPHFADVTLPLTELIKFQPKSKYLHWSSDAKTAFEASKNALVNASSLSFTNPESSVLQLVTDSSQYAVGAALHQIVDGNPIPISFFSKKLSETQRKYSSYDRELLAAYLSVLHFRPMIDGKQVTLFTDHKPLVSAFHSRLPAKTDRQQRHLSCISEYITDMQYICGQDNVVADTLSRNVHETTVETEPSTSNIDLNENSASNVNSVTLSAADLHAIARAQQADAEIQIYSDRLIDQFIEPRLPIKCENSTPHPRPFVPQSMRKAVYDSLHNLSHPGAKGSTRLIKSRYFWPQMDKQIHQWAAQCQSCQAAKINRHTHTSPIPLNIPSNSRFEAVCIDIVGPLPAVNSPGTNVPVPYRYLLTCIDRATKWIEAIPLPDISAKTVAFYFLHGWISRFSTPLYLLTDRGPQFESELFYELSKIIGFHRLRTAAYRPATNGLIERSHRTLKAAIMAKRQEWLTSLPVILLGVRCMPNESGISPFLAVTGKTPLSPRDLFVKPCINQEISSEFIRNFARQMKTLDFSELPDFHNKPVVYIPKKLENCSHVWLRVDRVRRSLEAPYDGPFKVIKRNERVFTIELPTGQHETVSIERCKPAVLPTENPIRYFGSQPAVPSSPPLAPSPTTSRSTSPPGTISDSSSVDSFELSPPRKKVRYRSFNDVHYIPNRNQC